VSDPFTGHAASSDLVKLLMDERNQLLEGGFVALAPGEEKSGDLSRMLWNAAILMRFFTRSTFDGCFSLHS
jgi:hypothetical protein